MGLGLALGYGAEGAQVGLERLLAQREGAKRLAMAEQAQQQNEAFRQKQLASQEALKQQALEEAAKRAADLDAYRRESLDTRTSIADLYERGRNDRAESERGLRAEMGLLRDATTRAGFDAAMARTLAQIGGAQGRAELNFTKPRAVTIQGPNGEPVTVMRRYYPDGAYEDVSSDVKPAAEAAQAQGAQIGNVLDEINRFEALYDPRLVGPARGRALKVGRSLGGVTSVLGDATGQKALGMMSTIQRIQDILLYARSGKQINETEFQRMMGELPRMDVEPADVELRIQQTKANLADLQQRLLPVPNLQNLWMDVPLHHSCSRPLNNL